MKAKRRNAEIVTVTEQYAQVRDDAGEIHNMITGSINGIPGAVVGQRGTVEYLRAASSGLWYFTRREWAVFRWASPEALEEYPVVELEVRMTREEFDLAVRHGERCGCGKCVVCRARQYWREGGYMCLDGEYPLDPEFDT